MSDAGDTICVLHVDDEPGLAELTATFLEREADQLDVQTATDPQTGLDILATGDVDCIVSDYDTPRQTGIEFLETVRENHPDLPFILYTGKGSEEVASEAVSAGVSDYLQKESGTDQYTLLANRIINLVSQARAEQELERTHEYFSRILNHASDYVLIISPDGRIEYSSPAVERVTGYTPDELEGTDALEYLHPADLPDATGEFSELLDTPGDERTVEYRARHANGSWRWFEVRGRNLLNDPIIDGVLVNVRDITERKTQERELETVNRRFEAVLENSTTPMFMKADDGSYLFVNRAYRELFDLHDQDIIGRTDAEIHPPGVASEVQANDQAVIDRGEPLETEERVLIDSEERIFLSTKVPIYDSGERSDPENPVAVFGVATDITERKRKTRQLDTLISNLPGIVYRAKNEPGWPMDLVRGECKNLTGYTATTIEDGDVSWGGDLIHPDDRERVWEVVQEALAEDRPFEVTYRIQSKDGTSKWLWERGRLVDTHATEEPTLEGFISDITDQKNRELELARTERRYQSVFNDPNILVGLVAPDGRVLDINQTAMEYIDASLEEVRNQPLWETPWFDHSENAQDAAREWIEQAANGEYIEFETELERPDGRPYFVEGAVRPVTNEDGDVVSLLISDRDVTERKERERELERMHEFFTEAEKLGNLGAWEVTSDQEVIWTEGTRRIHEVDAEFEPTLQSGIEFYHPDDRDRVRSAVETALESGEPYDVRARIITATGRERWIRTRGEPLGEGKRVRGYIQDITEQTERELELDRQLDLFQKAQDIANVGAWEYDIQHETGWWSEEARRIHGLPAGVQPSPELSFQYYHPRDRPRIRAAFKRAIDDGEPYDLELEFTDATGEHKWVRTRGEPLPADGEPEQLRGTIQDITERKEQEQAVQANRERYESLFTNIQDAIVVADTDRTIIDCNPAFSDLFGYAVSDVKGQPTSMLYENPADFEALGRSLTEPESVSKFIETVSYETKSGYTFPGETTVSFLRNAEGERTGFIGLIRDISERKERLRQLEMIDRVLRHNLHNDMNIILGHASLLRDLDIEDVSKNVEKITDTGIALLETMNKERTITKFLAEDPATEPHDAGELLTSAVEEVRQSYDEADIDVTVHDELEVSTVHQFRSALVELLENSIIHSDQTAPAVSVRLERYGDVAEFRIADQGPGLPEMERRLLVDDAEITPLYHGRGFGLWLVHVLVQHSKGTITISKNDPRGTIVTIRLPLV